MASFNFASAFSHFLCAVLAELYSWSVAISVYIIGFMGFFLGTPLQAVAELEKRLTNAEQDNIDLRAFLSIIRKCTDLKKLTPELVNRLITKIEVFDSTKDENGKKHVPIKVHFIGVGILEIPDAQTIIDAKEEIRKNPPRVA